MRWKHGDERRELESGCCWCCHIRTGAMIMGVLHLVWYILSLVIAGFIIVVMKQLVHIEIPSDVNATDHTDTVSFYLNTFKFNQMESNTWDDDDQYFVLAVLGGCIVCSLLLIYGAAKGEGSYLMPFFILKVFSFSLGCLYMISFCGGTWTNAEFKFDDGRMDINYAFVLWSLLFIVGVWMEAYFAYVAWSCYRYLRLTVVTRSQTTNGGYFGDEAEMLLPPKYEDIISSEPLMVDVGDVEVDTTTSSQPPPPAYESDEEPQQPHGAAAVATTTTVVHVN